MHPRTTDPARDPVRDPARDTRPSPEHDSGGSLDGAHARLLRALHGLTLATHSFHGQRRPPASTLAEQLAYLERDVQEVRSRVNALFFTVLAAAIGQLVARLLA